MVQETNLFSILRKSLIFASLVSGVFFILKSFVSPSVTGAIIGTSIIDPNILLAVTLFLLAMAVSHFYEK